MSHVRLGVSADAHTSAFAAGATVFPHYSARLAKETLLVVILVLIAAALVTLATLVPAEFFGATDPTAACSTLNPKSLLSPWCSALI